MFVLCVVRSYIENTVIPRITMSTTSNSSQTSGEGVRDSEIIGRGGKGKEKNDLITF